MSSMLCRQCGTEIADKAIICFRCGAGTTDPVRKAVPVRKKRSPLFSFLVLLLLVLLGLYLGQAAATGQQEAGPWQVAGAVVAALAIVLLVIRILRRR